MKIVVPDLIAYVDLKAAFNRAGIKLMYVDGEPTVIGISAPNSPWRNPAQESPSLLVDVLVTVIGDDGLPETDMGFMRRPGEWHLTGMERAIQPLAWMPLPQPHNPSRK